ncbi:hypothetical protein PUNSTDRAFT_111655 [Punctularia strigosozonata HHB-11173 SS5]|uniref:uncharacterized protein n=1 Tax=Punctularia strigosozonata (strain HHB-11173) TaxID=741275 RepID=UPI0004417201|nr:uncharacterized protein PUNSTDRAFT_111655 [Punctularia strigosozonata HHB-11173 SS5]EIN11546.1 hypothetical protein PUNSTDRAFT_111655 [Punctularia strigosozonata HHB-11173 SS5]
MVHNLPAMIKEAAQRLPSIDDPAFGAVFDSFGRSRVVLMGDASISSKEHGFNVVAIEADWPDAKVIDRYVRQDPSKQTRKLTDVGAFDRFPRWMWRNTETQEFVNWLEQRVSFAGLDLYSMGISIHSVQEYLERLLRAVDDDPALYGRQAFLRGAAPSEMGAVNMLKDLLEKQLELAKEDGEDSFDTEMNARLVRNVEKYYRAMFYGSDESTGKGSKAIVWAHNSHVGDAWYTGMGESRNELNIGQLCKEQRGTHMGTVATADEWDEPMDVPMEVMNVKPSRPDSYEGLMHEVGIPSFARDLREGRLDEETRQALMEKRLERFIGRWSHYSNAILPKQFDCYVWFDRTEAVHAFETAQPDESMSVGENHPFGL